MRPSISLLLLALGTALSGCASEPSPSSSALDYRPAATIYSRPMPRASIRWADAAVEDAPRCGDGFRSASEECDIAEFPDTRCPSGVVSCVLCVDCFFVGRLAPRCGNGVLDEGERCDDGNWAPDDGCTECTPD